MNEDPRKKGFTAEEMHLPPSRGQRGAADAGGTAARQLGKDSGRAIDGTPDAHPRYGYGVRVFEGEKVLCEAPIPETGLTIGRSSACDLVLASEDVSRNHARILQYERDKFRIEDLGSRNGIVVNGLRVPKLALKLDDEIRIGGFRLVVCGVAIQPGSEEHQGHEPAPDDPTFEGRTVAAYLKRSLLTTPTGRPSEKLGTSLLHPPAAAAQVHGGEIEVRCGNQITRFVFKSESGMRTGCERDNQDTVRIRLALGDWVLENVFPVSAMKQLRPRRKE